jgi:uncharacterized BrkB/YihY/UPF0761 family membrane protein
MESIMSFYAIFALTTALTGCFSLMRPALEKIRETHPLNNIAQSPFLAYTVFFIISLLFAPVMLVAIFVGKSNEKFIDTFARTITEEK